MQNEQVTVPRSITFLVLDDMESMRRAVVAQLKALGVTGKILEAADVAEAKQVTKDNVIEFFLSDWNLPDGTGFDFLKEVRQIESYKATPFLMITTEDEISKILDAINHGASNYLIKPWTPADFNDRFQSAWTKHNPLEKKVVVKKPITPASPTVPTVPAQAKQALPTRPAPPAAGAPPVAPKKPLSSPTLNKPLGTPPVSAPKPPVTTAQPPKAPTSTGAPVLKKPVLKKPE